MTKMMSGTTQWVSNKLKENTKFEGMTPQAITDGAEPNSK
jgi:hypothetical protein